MNSLWHHITCNSLEYQKPCFQEIIEFLNLLVRVWMSGGPEPPSVCGGPVWGRSFALWWANFEPSTVGADSTVATEAMGFWQKESGMQCSAPLRAVQGTFHWNTLQPALLGVGFVGPFLQKMLVSICSDRKSSGGFSSSCKPGVEESTFESGGRDCMWTENGILRFYRFPVRRPRYEHAGVPVFVFGELDNSENDRVDIHLCSVMLANGPFKRRSRMLDLVRKGHVSCF